MTPLSLTRSHPCSWPHPCPTHQIIFILGPLVLKAIQALQDGSPPIPLLSPYWLDFWGWSPLFARAHTTFSTLLSCSPLSMDPPLQDRQGASTPKPLSNKTFGAAPLLFCQCLCHRLCHLPTKKVNHHPTCPPLSPIPSSTLHPFKRTEPNAPFPATTPAFWWTKRWTSMLRPWMCPSERSTWIAHWWSCLWASTHCVAVATLQSCDLDSWSHAGWKPRNWTTSAFEPSWAWTTEWCLLLCFSCSCTITGWLINRCQLVCQWGLSKFKPPCAINMTESSSRWSATHLHHKQQWSKPCLPWLGTMHAWVCAQLQQAH